MPYWKLFQKDRKRKYKSTYQQKRSVVHKYKKSSKIAFWTDERTE